MEFIDLHNHSIYGVDDGAGTLDESLRMLGDAYGKGLRTVCLTPHYHPGYYGRNAEPVRRHFAEIKEKCAGLYPELTLLLGNELHYDINVPQWLAEGECNTMAGTDFLMVDFKEDDPFDYIRTALMKIQNAGYVPVFAHVEKYRSVFGKYEFLDACKRNGVVIQLDAGSVLGEEGFRVKRNALKILKYGLADLIASDAHHTDRRTWRMDEAFEFVKNQFDETYAMQLFRDNPMGLLAEYNAED